MTGHSYIVYGPLCNGATSLMFEGVPTFPDAGRFWQVVNKFKVTVFYTAPTAIRSLIRLGEEWPNKYDMSTLRTLGSVGEPINPEAWLWYHRVIGKGRCPIVDTWWQTETGGILITPLPGAHTLKPGSANRPFFGVEPVVLRDDGKEVRPERRRQALHQETVAGHDAHHLGRPRSVHRNLLHDVSEHLFHRRRLPH